MKRFFILCLVVGFVFPMAGLASGQSANIMTNSIGMKFVLIPAGTFQMGSPPGDRDRDLKLIKKKAQEDLEKASKDGGFLPPPIPIKLEVDYPPTLQVTISKPFFLQATEVTQGQWQKVMGYSPSLYKKCGKNCPVEKVSWSDAQEFIKKLNRMEKTDKYRLPTEAEWEYACRAGSTSRFTFGDDDAKLSQYAWYWKNSTWKTHPVGQLKPNAWGLYDMHGNVPEWCEDYYGKYSAGPVTDPKGPASGEDRVLRDGSFMLGDLEVHSAYRNHFRPGQSDFDFGFRAARDY